MMKVMPAAVETAGRQIKVLQSQRVTETVLVEGLYSFCSRGRSNVGISWKEVLSSECWLFKHIAHAAF
jgi:hypothetical protein